MEIPRSWSRCGRCSGRSGGTFFTSGFLSTGEGSHCWCVLLCLGSGGEAAKTEQYLRWAWLKGRREAAVSLVSADAQTHKAALLCQRETSFLFENKSTNERKSPPFPLQGASQNCQGRRLAVRRSHPSTSRRRRTPANTHSQRLLADEQVNGSETNCKTSRTALLTLVMMLMISPSLIVSSSSFCASYGKSTLHCSRPDTQIQNNLTSTLFLSMLLYSSWLQPTTIISKSHSICLRLRQNQEVSEEVKNKTRK